MKVKRIETGINMVQKIETCLAKGQPFSIYTRGELDFWLIDALSQNPFSEVHLLLNTMNEAKYSRLNNGECSKPDEIVDSIIDCFNHGIYTILSIQITDKITMLDVYQVLNRVMNWIPCIEISFDRSFTGDEQEEIMYKIKRFMTGTKAKIQKVGEIK